MNMLLSFMETGLKTDLMCSQGKCEQMVDYKRRKTINHNCYCLVFKLFDDLHSMLINIDKKMFPWKYWWKISLCFILLLSQRSQIWSSLKYFNICFNIVSSFKLYLERTFIICRHNYDTYLKTLDEKYDLINIIASLKPSIQKNKKEKVNCLLGDYKRIMETVTYILNEEGICLDAIVYLFR